MKEHQSPEAAALKAFRDGCQKFHSEAEVSKFASMLAVLSIKLINGIHGAQFKKEFLEGAMADKETIVIKRIQ